MMSACTHQGNYQGLRFFAGVKQGTCDACVLKIMTKVADDADMCPIKLTFVDGRSKHKQHNLPQEHVDMITKWVADLELQQRDQGGLAAVITALFKEEGVVDCSKGFQTMFLDACMFRTINGSEHAKHAHTLVHIDAAAPLTVPIMHRCSKSKCNDDPAFESCVKFDVDRHEEQCTIEPEPLLKKRKTSGQ